MQLDKVTTARRTEEKRRYDDACAAAHGMDLIGERWSMPLIRELLLGPRRFSDLRASLRGISANVLTQRLEGLESAGVLVRRKLPPPAAVQVYELTEWGYESEPIFQALGRWAARSPAHDPARPFSTASLVLSLRTMFNTERAKGMDARIGFRIGEETFLAHLSDGRIEIGRAILDEAEVILTGLPPVLAGAIYGGQALEALERTGALRVEGNRDLAQRFVSLFPLPPKASKPA